MADSKLLCDDDWLEKNPIVQNLNDVSTPNPDAKKRGR